MKGLALAGYKHHAYLEKEDGALLAEEDDEPRVHANLPLLLTAVRCRFASASTWHGRLSDSRALPCTRLIPRPPAQPGTGPPRPSPLCDAHPRPCSDAPGPSSPSGAANLREQVPVDESRHAPRLKSLPPTTRTLHAPRGRFAAAAAGGEHQSRACSNDTPACVACSYSPPKRRPWRGAWIGRKMASRIMRVQIPSRRRSRHYFRRIRLTPPASFSVNSRRHPIHHRLRRLHLLRPVSTLRPRAHDIRPA
ncbi:hypothetical protein C8R47DRAFT_595451 [Mycena vitilis]|nr:hypothetical protein C8R47DRAFT_595451 [Mycena vitilis]